MSLALMVAASDRVPRYIQDVILLHVAGVALLTLLINATTTGALVRFLGLSRYSDIKKNILVGLTYQLDKNVDENIEILKTKRHFNQVQWEVVRKELKMKELSKSLEKFKHINVDGVEINLNDELGDGAGSEGTHVAVAALDPLVRLSEINKKIAENQRDPLKNIKNLEKLDSNQETFKGQKKSRHGQMGNIYQMHAGSNIGSENKSAASF